MEKETLFTDPRWHILQSLAHQPQSPTQLAQVLTTTIANISQQLKLLEALNLVKKEKIRNRDKGKPRSLFSLVQDTALLVPTARNFAQRKLINLSDHQKPTLRIWLSPAPELHHALERLWWKLEEHKSQILAFAFDSSTKKAYVVSDNTALAKTGHADLEMVLLSPKEWGSLSKSSLSLIHGVL